MKDERKKFRCGVLLFILPSSSFILFSNGSLKW